MLAQSVMIVVFVLDESISLGRRNPDGCSLFLKLVHGIRTLKVPQRRSQYGNILGGTGKPHKRETQIW